MFRWLVFGTHQIDNGCLVEWKAVILPIYLSLDDELIKAPVCAILSAVKPSKRSLVGLHLSPECRPAPPNEISLRKLSVLKHAI